MCLGKLCWSPPLSHFPFAMEFPQAASLSDGLPGGFEDSRDTLWGQKGHLLQLGWCLLWNQFLLLQTKIKSKEETSAKPFVMPRFMSGGLCQPLLSHCATEQPGQALSAVGHPRGAVGTSAHLCTPCAASTTSHVERISCRAQTCPEPRTCSRAGGAGEELRELEQS